MGLTKDMKVAMDEWFRKMRDDMMLKLEEFCKSLEEKMERLECENGLLRSRMEVMEQRERGDCLEIHNIPVQKDEVPEELVVKIAKVMDLKIPSSEISVAYRIPVKKHNKEKPIPKLYVKFIKRKHKQLMFANRTKMPVSQSQLGFNSTGKIYIHEHLTKTQANLFHRARDKVRESSFKYIWTQNQKIYVKCNDTSTRILISDEKDLDNITGMGSALSRDLRSNSRSKS